MLIKWVMMWRKKGLPALFKRGASVIRLYTATVTSLSTRAFRFYFVFALRPIILFSSILIKAAVSCS